MELDIVEEIVRFFGVDNVPNNLPSIKLRPRKNNANLYRENKIRSALSASGFNEIVSYSFVSKSFANLFSALDVINLKNPISMEMDTLRPTIFSSMFPAILHNISRQIDQINFFEIGKVFFKKGVEDCEVNMLAACRYGRISGRHWCQETRDSDFFDAKNEEIVKIYSESFPNEKARIVNTLVEIDPTNSSKYQTITTENKGN